MPTKDISVIIPVYNTEEYLTECVDSLKNQNLNLEIIIIDDGSTDGSEILAEQLAHQNQKIKLIRQENQGLSAARNSGMEVATGAYIFFLDSDDCTVPHSLDYLYSEALKHDADVVMGNTVYCYPDKSVPTHSYDNINKHKHIMDCPLDGKIIYVELMKTDSFVPMACNYIYKREFLEKHRFQFENVLHEDEIWTPTIMAFASKMVVTNQDLYYYRQRDDSMTHTSNPVKRVNALFYITDRLLNLANNFSVEEHREYKSWLYAKIFGLYNLTFFLLSQTKDPSFILPHHHLHCVEEIKNHLIGVPKSLVLHYYQLSVRLMEKYILYTSCT